jgi:hypothetical protein
MVHEEHLVHVERLGREARHEQRRHRAVEALRPAQQFEPGPPRRSLSAMTARKRPGPAASSRLCATRKSRTTVRSMSSASVSQRATSRASGGAAEHEQHAAGVIGARAGPSPGLGRSRGRSRIEADGHAHSWGLVDGLPYQAPCQARERRLFKDLSCVDRADRVRMRRRDVPRRRHDRHVSGGSAPVEAGACIAASCPRPRLCPLADRIACPPGHRRAEGRTTAQSSPRWSVLSAQIPRAPIGISGSSATP